MKRANADFISKVGHTSDMELKTYVGIMCFDSVDLSFFATFQTSLDIFSAKMLEKKGHGIVKD